MNSSATRRPTLLRPNASRAKRSASLEFTRQAHEAAVVGANHVVKTVLVADLRLGEAVAPHAVEIEVGIDRVQLVVLADCALATLATANAEVDVRVTPGI